MFCPDPLEVGPALLALKNTDWISTQEIDFIHVGHSICESLDFNCGVNFPFRADECRTLSASCNVGKLSPCSFHRFRKEITKAFQN